MKDFKR